MKKSQKNSIILTVAALLLLLIGSITAVLSRSEKKPVSQTEFALDTICTVTLYNWDGEGQQLLSDVFTLCRQYENLLSTTVSGSDIYKINHSHGKTVTVSTETAQLLSDALSYCEMSGGKFDITIYPVKQLWDFSGNNGAIPDQDTLERSLRQVNYRQMVIEKNRVTLPEGSGIDLGAIAKGYITDRIAEYLQNRHVRFAVIDFGGNIRVIGTKPDGSHWKVGIQKPFDSASIITVQAVDESVVTSGIYQRYFTENGRLYHHILDPSTGMPCDTGLASVTVIAQSAEQADALSTVCMLLGYEASCQLLRNYPDTRAYFVTSDMNVLTVS